MKKTILVMFLVISTAAWSCPVGEHKLNAKEAKLLLKKIQSFPATKRNPAHSYNILPDKNSLQPWGGKDPKKWKPEAILANATSEALNQASSEKNLTDIRVSVPVQMIYTNNRPYGDGQTNSSLSFGQNWNWSEPQLIATLLTYSNGTRKLRLSFSSKLGLKNPTVSITGFIGNSRFDVNIGLSKIKDRMVGEWNVVSNYQFGDISASRVLWIKPLDWKDVFPIDFKFNLVSNKKLQESAVKGMMDPLKIKNQMNESQKSSMEVLLGAHYGQDWDQSNQGPYNPLIIHGELNVNGKIIKTSVGQGWTWVANKSKNFPFKNLYTCFDSRNFEAEAESGVPSGGGWHEIGDAAETIINNMEDGPIVVGMATGLPWPTPPDGAGFSWGLTDVAVVGWIKPGEALLTSAGDQTWREDTEFRKNNQFANVRGSGNSGGRNYHWFTFQSDKPVCTQEWVHNCIPSDTNLGLSCP